MKLNQDCIRDLLLYLEENLTLASDLCIDCYSQNSFLSNYSMDDLRYTTLKLAEANYLEIKAEYFIDTNIPIIYIKSITFNGHKFLDTIRDNKVWTKTKTILSFLKSVSIDVISETASKVVISLIDQQLNAN